MPQAVNVISFPLDAGSTDLLANYIAPPQRRLDEVVLRLEAIASLLVLLRGLEDELTPVLNMALYGIETLARDGIAVCELRPVEHPA